MATLDPSDTPWGAAKTAAFRWFVVFSLLFIVPLNPLTDLVIPWIGQTLLGIEREIAVEMTGSGDTTAEYIRLLLHAAVAGAGTLVWTALGDARARYVKLLEWFTYALRFAVATAMLGYGVAKLTEGQFSPPSDIRLFQAYGDSSPMGLLWTFMGHSPAYTVFSGVAEILGGVLLLSRRATTLGALVVVGVMSNVVMLNFCYDVPVKLYSSRLLLWALFIAGLDARRLYALFANAGRTAPRPLPRLFAKPKAHLAGQIVKTLIALAIILSAVLVPMMMQPSDPGTTSSIRRTYVVTSFQRDGVQVPPLVTAEDRWHRVVLSDYDSFVVFGTDGVRTFYLAKLEGDSLTLTKRRAEEKEEEEVIDLTLSELHDGGLRLEGVGLEVALEPHEGSFLLRDRGFHWIQERPYNR